MPDENIVSTEGDDGFPWGWRDIRDDGKVADPTLLACHQVTIDGSEAEDKSELELVLGTSVNNDRGSEKKEVACLDRSSM
jgi:hypothetical protein